MDQSQDAMEEDIDIEEHDVLDNPRIRDMLLDIGNIKVEVEDTDVQMIEFEDYPQIQSIEGDIPDFNENENDILHYDSDSMPEFTSKIVLGSKPNKEKLDPEILYKNALNSKTYVDLEDWGERLNTSPCFCCQCKILFATRNALDSHNMAAHSFLIEVNDTPRNVAKKSTVVKMKNCHHCNQLFSDDNALIKHLYELLPLRNEEPEQISNISGYQCVICSCYYTDIREIITHLRLNHGVDKKPEVTMINFHCPFCGVMSNSQKFYNMHIAKNHRPTFCKKVEKIDKKRPFSLESSIKKEIDSSDVIQKIKMLTYNRCSLFTLKNSPIPKAVLFICDKCSVHFVSAHFAVKHYYQCKNSKSAYCKDCNRKIRHFDRFIHQAQHTISNKFKVYKISTELYKKVLCKCPVCNICFEDNEFWMHFPKCGCIVSIYCQKCDASISDRDHFIKHRKFKNLIIVDFVSMTDERTELIPTPKSIELSEKIKNNPRKRRTGFIAQILKKDFRRNCASKALKKDINLNKLKNSVVHMRAEGSKFVLRPKDKQEMKIPLKKDGKVTVYYCTKCECCFSILRHWRHSSKVTCLDARRKVCCYCGLYYSRRAHIAMHKKKNLSFHDLRFVTTNAQGIRVPVVPNIPEYFHCTICNVGFVSEKERKDHSCKQELSVAKTCSCGKKYNLQAFNLHSQFHVTEQSDSKIMPKLLMQYELMVDMWNLLFFCQYCNVCTDSYDRAVDHSQKHLNGLENFEKVKICKVCSLNFEFETHAKHKMLHKRNVKVNKESFKILTFDYTDLLRKEWFKVFDGITKEQQEYILSKSIYKQVRNIKMECIKSGLHNAPIEYYCSRCNKVVDESRIYIHTHAKSCKPGNQIPSSLSSRVVLFNKPIDEQFNNTLKFERKEKRYNIYKCSKCTLCLINKYNRKRHNCSFNNKKRRFCKICGQFFPLVNHEAIHKKLPNLHKSNINIIRYNTEVKHMDNKPKTKFNHTKIRKYIVNIKKKSRKKDIVKIYKCDCNLHFTSKLTLKKHAIVCGNKNVSAEKCAKCGLLFPVDVLATHSCMHHRKSVRFEVDHLTQVKVYRCPDCELLFTNKSVLLNHQCKASDGVKCKICDLVFHKTMIDYHRCDTINVIEDLSMDTKVYACKPCNLNFNLYHSWVRHQCQDSQVKIKATPCNFCGIRFSTRSTAMHVHKLRHHARDEFSFVLVDPVTSEEVIISGNTENSSQCSNNDNGDEYIIPDKD